MNSEFQNFKVLAPLTKAPADVMANFGLSVENCQFLVQVGLPSNALKSDPFSRNIMTFDCLANPRLLESVDLAIRAQGFVRLMGKLMIVGVCGSHFACIRNTGEIYLIESRPLNIAMESDAAAAERSVVYLNSSPYCLMESLCCYRLLRNKIDQPSGEVHLTKEAVDALRTEIGNIDLIALEKSNSYWRSIIDDLDVW